METNKLTSCQQKGLEVLLNNTNCFISGDAGTGKSYLIDYFSKHYCSDKKVAKCCFVANSVNNLTKDKDSDVICTIHSLFDISSIGLIEPTRFIPRSLIKKIALFDVIIIDEISMVRADLFEYITRVISRANAKREKDIEFIVVGDFFQLPPVVAKEEKELLYKLYNTYDGYCFETRAWSFWSFKYIKLEDKVRQKDPLFLKYLNCLRNNENINEAISWFNLRYQKNLKHNQEGVVEIYPTNSQVDKVNELCLDSLKDKPVTIHAYYDNDILHDIRHNKLDKDSLPANLTLTLKPNCRVMFVRNDKEVEGVRRFSNGDMATVLSCSEEEVVVRLDRNNKLVHLHKYNCGCSVYKPPKYRFGHIYQEEYIGLYKQYPLKLAYAITIHKAQGKTFNKVYFNPKCRKGISLGQLYVALSRVRDINDLYLFNPIELERIECNDKVIEFYKGLEEDITDKIEWY